MGMFRHGFHTLISRRSANATSWCGVCWVFLIKPCSKIISHRHPDGPPIFDCSDISADNSTVLLVQALEPLPHWFSARSRFEEPGWENFQRVIHAHIVPYMVQYVKLMAAWQKRQGCLRRLLGTSV